MSTTTLKQKLMLRSRLSYFAKNFHKIIRFKFRQKFIKTRFGIELIRNYHIDRKYGGNCGGKFRSRFANTGAHGTSSIDYCYMPMYFCPENDTVITPSDVLVDIGCGRGRVLNWFLELGLGNKIIGIELDEQFANEAADRLRGYSDVTVICGDAIKNLPPDATKLFLFNPFNSAVMEAFKNRAYELYKDRPDLRIIYPYCRSADVWRQDQRWVVEYGRKKTFYKTAIIRLRQEADGAWTPSTN